MCQALSFVTSPREGGTRRLSNFLILSNTLEQAQMLLPRVETCAKQTGLHINNTKTEYIKFNQGEGYRTALGVESIKNVDCFLYLGSWIDCCTKDVNVKIEKM